MICKKCLRLIVLYQGKTYVLEYPQDNEKNIHLCQGLEELGSHEPYIPEEEKPNVTSNKV
jgi:hypothetical protein